MMALFREWAATLNPPFKKVDIIGGMHSCYCLVCRQMPSSTLWHYMGLQFSPGGLCPGEQCWLEVGITQERCTLDSLSAKMIWNLDEACKGGDFYLRPEGLWSRSRSHAGWLIKSEYRPLKFDGTVSEEQQAAIQTAQTAIQEITDSMKAFIEVHPAVDSEQKRLKALLNSVMSPEGMDIALLHRPEDREGIFLTPEDAMEHLKGRILNWVLPYMVEMDGRYWNNEPPKP